MLVVFPSWIPHEVTPVSCPSRSIANARLSINAAYFRRLYGNFIATYNEDYDILERTIVGAMAIAHPDLRGWVLDDGARPWVRDLARELGALYRFRIKGYAYRSQEPITVKLMAGPFDYKGSKNELMGFPT